MNDIDRAAKKAGVPVRLYRILINRGERSGANAVSPMGATGRAQLMPGTARALEQRYKINTRTGYGNLLGGAYYLKEQLDRFGSVRLAVAAYNAGPGAVEKYGGIPPYKETQDYVARIVRALGKDVNAKIEGGEVSTGPAEPPSIQPDTRELALGNLQDIGEGDFSATESLGQLAKLAQTAKQAAADTPAGPRVRAPQPAQDVDPGKWVIIPKPGGRGPQAGPAIISFAAQIAQDFGKPLTAFDNTLHSKYTVNGNVSAHSTGHALDLAARGAKLKRLGYLALLRAGMPKAEALKASRKGGLFNVGNYQIIFATQIGGDHSDHLHVGIRG